VPSVGATALLPDGAIAVATCDLPQRCPVDSTGLDPYSLVESSQNFFIAIVLELAYFQALEISFSVRCRANATLSSDSRTSLLDLSVTRVQVIAAMSDARPQFPPPKSSEHEWRTKPEANLNALCSHKKRRSS